MKEIDHSYTSKIVCPHCGHQYDHWDLEIYGEETETIECGECEKEFDVFGHLSQSFSTKAT